MEINCDSLLMKQLFDNIIMTFDMMSKSKKEAK